MKKFSQIHSPHNVHKQQHLTITAKAIDLTDGRRNRRYDIKLKKSNKMK